MKQHANKSRRGAQRPLRFYMTSLGCPKNTVDANGMTVLLQRTGYLSVEEAVTADVIIVNTCGFIAPARQESLEVLQEFAVQLRPGQRLIAAGCWAQRAPQFLLDAVPALTAIIGTRSWTEIVPLLEHIVADREDSLFELIETRPMARAEEAAAPGYAVAGVSAFLKIADGCSRQCAFCAIPHIKGATVSRALAAILADAQALQAQGVLEINIIAQDATFYGHDLGMKDGLAELLEQMVHVVPQIPWLRVLYAFPGYVTPRLIDVMARHPQILPYVDIPLQHAHPAVLRRMQRPADMDAVRQMITQLRAQLPGVALRTTFIVGFPGETEAEFATLLDFVNEIRFDRVGVFTYSHEAGTAAALLADDVPAEVKEARREAVMLAQQCISQQLNQAWVGKRLPVLLEGANDDLTVGRSYRDAPEIDGLVLIRGEIPTQRLVTVEITEALEYDLIGRVVAD